MQRKNKGLDKQAFSLLICIIAAFALWVYVSYVENPQMTRRVADVPITIVGESKLHERSLAVADVSREEINPRIQTRRNQFKYLSAETITASIDVSSIVRTGMVSIPVQFTFPSTTSDVSVAERNQTTIDVLIEDYVTEHFTIEPSVTQKPKNGYFVKSTHIDNKDMQIAVSGCESSIARISHIITNDIDLSNATDDVVIPVSFKALDEDGKVIDNIIFEMNEANITFVIYKTTTVPVKVSVVADDPGLESRAEPGEVDITGPASVVDLLQYISTATVNEYAFNSGDEINRNLSLPAFVSLRDSAHSSVKVVFSEKED